MADEKETINSMKELIGLLELAGGNFGALSRKIPKAGKTIEELTATVIDMGSQFADGADNMDDALEAVKAFGIENGKVNKTIKNVTKSVELQSRTTLDLVKSFGALSGKGVASFNKISTSVVGASFSFKGAYDQVMSYNKSMVELSRMATLSGTGLGNVDSELQKVSKSTSYSKTQFLELSASMSSMWKGIPPGIQETGKLAAMFERAFGANLDAKKKGMEAFMQVQSKYPALAKQIQQAEAMRTKIKSGGASGAMKEELRIKEAMIAVTAQAAGIEGAALQNVLSLTSDASSKQQEYNKTLKTQAEAAREVQDSLLAMGQALEPQLAAIAKGIGGIASFVGQFGGAIATTYAGVKLLTMGTKVYGAIAGQAFGEKVGGAIASTTKKLWAKVAATKALKLAQLGWAGLAVVGIGAVAYAIVNAHKKTEEFEKQLAALKKESEGLNGVTHNMGSSYDELTHKAKEFAVGGAEAYSELVEGSKMAVLEIARINQNYETSIALSGKLAEQYEQQANILRDLFSLDVDKVTELFGGQMQAIENTKQAALKYFKDITEQSGKLASELGLDIRINPDSSDAEKFQSLINSVSETMSELQSEKVSIEMELVTAKGDDKKELEAELEAVGTKLQALGTIATGAQKAQKSVMEATTQSVKAQLDYVDRLPDAAEDFNKVLGERLSLERDVAKSARMGLGYDLAMLQKQVDLNATMAEQEQGRKASAQSMVSSNLKLLQTKTGMTDAARDQLAAELEGVTSLEHAQSLINEAAGEQVQKNQELEGAQAGIIAGLKKREQAESNILKYQQQIFELTKDIREGYLDSVTEMMAGNSVYNKIIATSSNNVSGLLDIIGEANNGVAKGNTVRFGGMQTKDQTAAGMGDTRGSNRVKFNTYGVSGKFETLDSRIWESEEAKKARKDLEEGRVVKGTVSAADAAKGDEQAEGALFEAGLNAQTESLNTGLSNVGGKVETVAIATTEVKAAVLSGAELIALKMDNLNILPGANALTLTNQKEKGQSDREAAERTRFTRGFIGTEPVSPAAGAERSSAPSGSSGFRSGNNGSVEITLENVGGDEKVREEKAKAAKEKETEPETDEQRRARIRRELYMKKIQAQKEATESLGEGGFDPKARLEGVGSLNELGARTSLLFASVKKQMDGIDESFETDFGEVDEETVKAEKDEVEKRGKTQLRELLKTSPEILAAYAPRLTTDTDETIQQRAKEQYAIEQQLWGVAQDVGGANTEASQNLFREMQTMMLDEAMMASPHKSASQFDAEGNTVRNRRLHSEDKWNKGKRSKVAEEVPLAQRTKENSTLKDEDFTQWHATKEEREASAAAKDGKDNREKLRLSRQAARDKKQAEKEEAEEWIKWQKGKTEEEIEAEQLNRLREAMNPALSTADNRDRFKGFRDEFGEDTAVELAQSQIVSEDEIKAAMSKEDDLKKQAKKEAREARAEAREARAEVFAENQKITQEARSLYEVVPQQDQRSSDSTTLEYTRDGTPPQIKKLQDMLGASSMSYESFQQAPDEMLRATLDKATSQHEQEIKERIALTKMTPLQKMYNQRNFKSNEATGQSEFAGIGTFGGMVSDQDLAQEWFKQLSPEDQKKFQAGYASMGSAAKKGVGDYILQNDVSGLSPSEIWEETQRDHYKGEVKTSKAKRDLYSDEYKEMVNADYNPDTGMSYNPNEISAKWAQGLSEVDQRVFSRKAQNMTGEEQQKVAEFVQQNDASGMELEEVLGKALGTEPSSGKTSKAQKWMEGLDEADRLRFERGRDNMSMEQQKTLAGYVNNNDVSDMSLSEVGRAAFAQEKQLAPQRAATITGGSGAENAAQNAAIHNKTIEAMRGRLNPSGATSPSLTGGRNVISGFKGDRIATQFGGGAGLSGTIGSGRFRKGGGGTSVSSSFAQGGASENASKDKQDRVIHVLELTGEAANILREKKKSRQDQTSTDGTVPRSGEDGFQKRKV